MIEQCISSSGPLRGTIRVPGDKSISHRSLLFGALAPGVSTIRGLSQGDDVHRTRLAMESMGAVVTGDDVLTVTGGRDRLHEPESVIDLGNSGTGMRLMVGWCAAMPWLTILTGDASLQGRPMLRALDPVRRMGAHIDGRNNGENAPLVVRGGALTGIDYAPPVASAQLKSVVLIAGLAAEGTTLVREPVVTRTHIEEMLARFGADVTIDESNDGTTTIAVRRSELEPFAIEVPGDPSQAAFWMVAAAVVPDSDVTIENVYLGPGRGGVVDVLTRMGADIDLRHIDGTTADVRIRYSRLRASDIGGDEIPSLIDELPVLSVAAALAEGTTTVRDATEMRVKESDRVSAVVKQIGGLGMEIEERSDGFIIEGRPGSMLRGGLVDAHLDHRIAMTGAIAALVSNDAVTIRGWDSVQTSYPTFLDDLAQLKGNTAG